MGMLCCVLQGASLLHFARLACLPSPGCETQLTARPEKGGDGKSPPLTSVLCCAMVFRADLHLQQRTEVVLTVYMHKVDSVQEG